jgi:Zn-dependent protease
MQVAGIPVRIEPAFVVVIVLLGLPQPWFRVVTWVLIATVSVLLHEMGHAVAFRAYGVKPSILLHGFGGLTSGTGDLTSAQRIVVSLAGPLSALLLFGLPALLLEWAGAVPSGEASVILGQIVWINVGWSILNLIPVLPLDGGQVFLDVCDICTGGRGRRAAEIVSVVVAVVLAVVAISYGFLFGAIMAGGFAALNLNQLRQVRQDELIDRLAVAHRALLEHRPDEARAVAEEVLRKRPQGSVLSWAAELLGWAHLMQGDVQGAEPASAAAAPLIIPSSSLRGAVALADGRRAEGISVMAWVFAHDEARPPKSLAAVAIGGTGTAVAVAQELVLMGDEGHQGAVLLRDLLAYAGYHAAAAEVEAVLTPQS